MDTPFSLKQGAFEAKYQVFLTVIIFAFDRALKWYTLHSLTNEGVSWIPGWLGLERYNNTGIAFSLPVDRMIVLIATLVVVIGLVQNILRHHPSKRMLVALTFLVLGAASNFYDRLAYGYVLDYLRLGPLSLVNIADGMVIVGILLLLSNYKKTTKEKKSAEETLHHEHTH